MPSAITTDALRGVWGFPLTPFAGSGIDLEALASGAEYQLDGGVDVLCVAGAIAQMEQLRPEERLATARAVLAATRRRAPVVAAVPASGEGPAAAAALVDAGVDGLLVVPFDAEPEAAFGRLRAIALAAPQTPLVLYHRPPLRMEPDHLRRLCTIDTLVALKDGHRDVRLFRRLRSALGGRLLWVTAWEDVAPAFWAMGADAFCPFSTAYAPEYSRAWLAALERGDRGEAEMLLAAHAYPMVDLRLSRPGIDIAVVKAAMTARGLPAGGLRSPTSPLTDSERQMVERLVGDLPAALNRTRRSPSPHMTSATGEISDGGLSTEARSERQVEPGLVTPQCPSQSPEDLAHRVDQQIVATGRNVHH